MVGTAIIYIIVFLPSGFIEDTFLRNIVELRAEIDWPYFEDGTWEVKVEDQTSVQSRPEPGR